MAKLFGLARIGRDAEVKFTPGGDAVAGLALAFDYGKKENGKKPTQWVNGALWGKRAEALAPYLLKGQQVVVTLDDVHIRSWDKDGKQGFALEGRVIDIEFAGSPPAAQQDQAARTPPPPRRTEQPAVAAQEFVDDFLDDLPF